MCNESYTTSNGAKSHKCPKAKTIQTTQLVDILPVNLKKDESPEFKNAIENLLRFICVSNVPLRALDDEFFRRALFFLNKDFDFPKRTIMTKRLELLANIIREDNYKKLSDQKISLLFDSARKWSKEYQALIAYTVKGLYLIFLEQTRDNKANSISPLIIHAIEKFKSIIQLLSLYAPIMTIQTKKHLIQIKESFKNYQMITSLDNHMQPTLGN